MSVFCVCLFFFPCGEASDRCALMEHSALILRLQYFMLKRNTAFKTMEGPYSERGEKKSEGYE